MDWSIVEATESDRLEALKWMNEEMGWNNVKSDFQVWKQTFEAGCFLAAKTRDGQLVGFCIGARHPNTDIGFIGEYIVRKDARGRGIGGALFRNIMDNLKNCTNVGLLAEMDGTMAAKYERSGFTANPEWHIDRYVIPQPDIEKLKIEDSNTYKIVGLESLENLEKLSAYDASICSIDRSLWLSLWIKHPGGAGKICMDKSGHISGYGVIRKESAHNYRVGPLYADTGDVANSLLKSLLSVCPNLHDIYVEIFAPSNNKTALELVGRLNTTGKMEKYRNIHMFTTRTMPVDCNRVFSLSDVEVNFV